MLATLPSSSNYKLNNYGIGTGGTSNSSSSNYKVNGISGEASIDATNSTNFKNQTGEKGTQQANVPTVTLSNPANYYNKLLLVIGPQNNPSDATFAVAISEDNFAADTRYVKSDNTVGASLSFPIDYRTYASWGSASGINVIGLKPNTTYYVKAKAMHDEYTETGYGPVSSVATSPPQLSFDIDVAATDIDTNPPFSINMGNLNAGTVIDSPQRVWVDLDSNGESGAKVYTYSANSGLKSTKATYTISSATADLGSALEGFGAQGQSVGQTSGGPLTITSPYNGSTQNVGLIDTVIREIFTSAGPITAGRGSFLLKAKARASTPAASDYAETVTVIAASSY